MSYPPNYDNPWYEGSPDIGYGQQPYPGYPDEDFPEQMDMPAGQGPAYPRRDTIFNRFRGTATYKAGCALVGGVALSVIPYAGVREYIIGNDERPFVTAVVQDYSNCVEGILKLIGHAPDKRGQF